MILRWDVVNNWRKMLNLTIGMAIGLFCVENATMPKPYYGDVDPFATLMYDAAMTMVICVIMFYLAYGGTTILADMRTKQERITTLMLPGTNLEKFLSKLTKSLVIFFLLTVVAFLLAEVARMIVAMVFHHVSTDSLIPYTWKYVTSTLSDIDDIKRASIYYMYAMMWIFGASIGTLGGVIFNRNPFVCTALCIIIASTLFGAITIQADGEVIGDFINALGDASIWVSGIFVLALALAIFYLSYRIFCRIQAVNSKFFNL